MTLREPRRFLALEPEFSRTWEVELDSPHQGKSTGTNSSQKSRVLVANGHLEKWGRPHFSVTLTKSLDGAQRVPISSQKSQVLVANGHLEKWGRPHFSVTLAKSLDCAQRVPISSQKSRVLVTNGYLENLEKWGRHHFSVTLTKYMTVLDVAYGAADRASGKGDCLGDSGPRPEPEPVRATDKDKKKCGWQESDGPAIAVVWEDLRTKRRRRELEPLDYVLTWQEEDGHYADLHWRRTIMEEVMGKSTPYRPVGDSSVVSRAGACSAGTAVAQRFRLDKPYACLAMALFNLCNAPKRYKEKLRSEFKRSVDCYPIFYEYLNELEKQGQALAIVSREPLKKRGTGWLFDGTAPLGILVHKGHAYGIDPARQLVFDGKSTVARPLTDLAAIGIHASNTPYEWLTVTPL
eukprot:g65254.t1